MKLRELLSGITSVEDDLDINGLALHSQQVNKGDAFLAVAGVNWHGLRFAEQAIANGAVVILYEMQDKAEQMPEQLKHCLLIGIKDLANQLGEIAARFYGFPTRKLKVVGITGTNGKTSCSFYLAQALDDCAVLGTLGWGRPENLQSTVNTTPDALSIQAIMAECVHQHIKTVAMEVSSHGLHQGRVNGVFFKGVIFTNISRDHLDYHGSMEAYFKAKLTLLEKPGIEFVVLNLDDAYCDRVISAIKPGIKPWTFSCTEKKTRQGSSLLAKNIVYSEHGMQFDACFGDQSETVNIPLYGTFNLQNSMAVLTAKVALGVSLQQAVLAMQSIRPVAGRMEYFNTAKDVKIFVDYAHTPDALDKVLSSLRQHCKKHLWIVFGCGGDRDQGKRAQMGRIAEQAADYVILTNDNPRTEKPELIIEDILDGMSNKDVEVMMHRERAIKSVFERAHKGDLLLIAGKGHEQYQDINGQKIPYSDVGVVKQLLN